MEIANYGHLWRAYNNPLILATSYIRVLSYTHRSYTPVCTTELGEAAVLDFEFRNRGVQIVGFSCSEKEQHAGWIRDIQYVSGQALSFPIFSDPTRQYAELLGILDKSNTDRQGRPLTVRAVYVLDPNKTIRWLTAYPARTGRNMGEILRSLDSLLLTEQHPAVATPCNWKPGDDVLVDHSVSDPEADRIFGKDQYRVVAAASAKIGANNGETNREETNHYLRYTKDPSKWKDEGYEPPF